MKKIPLTKGLFALVDDEDFERVNAFNWYASLESRGTKYYAIRKVRENGKQRKIRMSHFVLDVTPEELAVHGFIVDHVNHNSLDNRKFIDGEPQLELITQAENMRRSEGWKKRLEPVECFL